MGIPLENKNENKTNLLMKHIEFSGTLMELNNKLRNSEFITLSDWDAPTKITIDILDKEDKNSK